MWRQFWLDERGAFLNSAELVFLSAILVIGIVPGISALRDAIVTELADMAQAVSNVNQHVGPGDPSLDPYEVRLCSDLFPGEG
jgi:Flp pilus assembly pilin Flp